jgi:hypothetical protein
MELDPIVLLAYVSVAVNIITITAAAVAYLVFSIRRRRRRAPRAGPAASLAAAEPVFLRPYRPRRDTVGAVAASESTRVG